MLIYVTLLLLSTFIALSASTFFMLWVSMEVSLLALMPLLSKHNSPSTNEAMLKYFLIQIPSGLIFLGGIFTPTPSYFLIFPIFMKLGLFPFFSWVPHIYKGLPILAILLLSTVQKFPPLTVLSLSPNNFAVMIGMASIFIGGLGGLLLSNYKLILAYSSVSHSGWLTILSSLNFSWLTYFIFYSSILFSFFILLNSLNLKSAPQLFKQISPLTTVSFWIILLSLAGLPPLAGFYLKWLALSSLAFSWPLALLPLVVIFSFSLFFYLNMFILTTLPMSVTSYSRSSPSLYLAMNLFGLLPVFFMF